MHTILAKFFILKVIYKYIYICPFFYYYSETPKAGYFVKEGKVHAAHNSEGSGAWCEHCLGSDD